MIEALSRRTPATTASRTNTFLRAGLGGVLLALTVACGGDLGEGLDGIEGEPLDSELVDGFDAADAPEAEGVIEKATFDDNLTFDGFNVACTAQQKATIREAEARAREILDIAMPATADARVDRTTFEAGRFQIYFVPDGDTDPDPNRPIPDAWDIAALRVGQKLVNVSQVLATVVHTCHGPDETVARLRGELQTCSQSPVRASTNFDGGAENAIRWCDGGLAQGLNARAITLLHELTHQTRTADATGKVVIDDDSEGRVYNAVNYSNWFLNNTPE